MTRSLRSSGLPAPARLIVHELATRADNDTAVVPEDLSVSLTELAEATGLGRSTVARSLNLLESLGWVKRDRPEVAAARSEGARTGYALKIGGSPRAGLVPERDYRPSPGAGLPVVPERDTTTSTSIALTSTSRRASRPDVDALCERLAEGMLANGCKPPSVTNHWRDEARRLLDRDGRELDKALALIDWSQRNPFWSSNIHSIPTFRRQYDKLRLAALAEWERERQPARSAFTAPPSNAPVVIPQDERCALHRAYRATACPSCKSERLAKGDAA